MTETRRRHSLQPLCHQSRLKRLPPKYGNSIIIVNMRDFEVRRIMIDIRSSTDILYSEAFEKMNLKKKHLKSCSVLLIGCIGYQAPVEGSIILEMTIIDYEQHRTMILIEFLVVRMESTYNRILRRLFLFVHSEQPLCHTTKLLIFSLEERRSNQE